MASSTTTVTSQLVANMEGIGEAITSTFDDSGEVKSDEFTQFMSDNLEQGSEDGEHNDSNPGAPNLEEPDLSEELPKAKSYSDNIKDILDQYTAIITPTILEKTKALKSELVNLKDMDLKLQQDFNSRYSTLNNKAQKSARLVMDQHNNIMSKLEGFIAKFESNFNEEGINLELEQRNEQLVHNINNALNNHIYSINDLLVERKIFADEELEALKQKEDFLTVVTNNMINKIKDLEKIKSAPITSSATTSSNTSIIYYIVYAAVFTGIGIILGQLMTKYMQANQQSSSKANENKKQIS